jgi:uncharacterized protein YgiM (DUF1202 family)
MALAVVVCFGGFTWLYVELDPWVRDFAGVEPAPTSTPRDSASNDDEDDDEDENPPDDEEDEDPEPTNTPEREDQPDDEPNEVEENNRGFDGDYQVIALEPVNLRGGPGVNFDIVTSVDPGTELEFLGNREPSANPDADGDIEWLNFETEDGLEGWIRQIDVSET